MEVTDARQLSRDAQEKLRKRVVMAVEEKGIKWLSKKKQGRPKESGKLAGWQAACVARTITDKFPEQLKMAWGLWTREAIRELIKETFKIELSISSVSRLLKKWGFTPQKPIRQAYQRNPKVITKWMQEEYPKIHKQAKKEKARMYWGDEMGLKSTDQVGPSFGRRGQTPVVQTFGSRYSCNMISAISNAGSCRFMVFKERFTNKRVKYF
jgi:transposase